MSYPTRLETNFTRLLGQCNRAISENKVDDWRLEAYVASLETMLIQLKQAPNLKNETMSEYCQQVEFLKRLLHADKLPSPLEKSMANTLISPGPTSSKKTTREIHLKTTNKYTNEMRKELLNGDGLRHRTTYDVPEDDYDAILKYHQNKQEKVAEEMVAMARNLKENSLLAGTIVRKDTENIEKSSRLTDQNYDRLKVESGRLEQHTKRSCNWWIWIMLVLVCVTFIWMIMFMKLFPKKNY